MSNDQIIAAVNAAAQTWTAVDPLVQLVYDGTTTAAPGGFNDVVGYAPSGGDGNAQVYQGHGFDIQLAPIASQWKPCDPAHGDPCTDYYTGTGADDVQQVATHEWGHVLGIGHAANTDDIDLTMFGQANSDCPRQSSGYTCRFAETLGYGDVLAVRALYPTSAPFPTLYYP